VPETTTDETTEVERYLIKNQAKCLKCGDVLVSRHRHDFVTCSCGALSVDGGQSYARRLFKEQSGWEEQSVYTATRPVRGDHQLEHSDQIVHNTHPAGACYGEHCTLHALSDHVLRGCTQVWAGGLMWRKCEHDAYHPDPDEMPNPDVVDAHECCEKKCCDGAYAEVAVPAVAST
jgi:hypothetical protein